VAVALAEVDEVFMVAPDGEIMISNLVVVALTKAEEMAMEVLVNVILVVEIWILTAILVDHLVCFISPLIGREKA
jgi:hypothetical protein